MVYTIEKRRNPKKRIILLVWDGIIVAAPVEWDWAIGRRVGGVLEWADRRGMGWKVSQ